MAEDDPSGGWEAIAGQFMELRSRIGEGTVRQWARSLPPGGSVLDVGCGSGVPLTAVLVEHGFSVAAVDASPTLVAAFRRRFPDVPVACEAAEDSDFFGRTFDGVIAVGLLFLIPESAQRELIRRVGEALSPGGRFLFTAPAQRCTWEDILTGRTSLSLGIEEYSQALENSGMVLLRGFTDEGENYYYDAVKRRSLGFPVVD